MNFMICLYNNHYFVSNCIILCFLTCKSFVGWVPFWHMSINNYLLTYFVNSCIIYDFYIYSISKLIISWKLNEADKNMLDFHDLSTKENDSVWFVMQLMKYDLTLNSIIFI